MSIRHAETGRPTGHPRRDHSEDVQRITSAPAPAASAWRLKHLVPALRRDLPVF